MSSVILQHRYRYPGWTWSFRQPTLPNSRSCCQGAFANPLKASSFPLLSARPYTSGAVSAFSAEAMFSTENSIYSTRPSTSACSLGAQTRASSRSLRPRPWCQTSRRRNEGSRSNHGGLSSRSLGGSQTPLQRDRRGYETFEQLLQPGWRTPAELQEILAPKQVNENSRPMGQ